MNVLLIQEETFQSLQSFKKVEEMNEAIRTYTHHHQLGETDRTILHTISQYACKYTGVCYLSKQKIAEAAGFKSRRTAIRSCNRMEELGIIKQYETRRIGGDKRRSTNIIVIQPAEKMSSPNESQRRVTAESHGKEAVYKTSLQTKTYKDTYIDTEVIFKRGLKTQIPEPFYNAFEPFFDAKTLYEIYGILLRAKASVDPLFTLEQFSETYIDHFYNVIRLYKWGKVRHLKGYLYRAWEQLTLQLHRQMLVEQGRIPEVYLYEYE